MNTLIWNELDAAGQAAALTRPVQTVAAQTRDAVAGLIAQVRREGDAGLRAITQRFDGVAPDSFEVSECEFAAAEAAVSAELRQAMVDAIARIRLYHEAGMAQPYSLQTAPGVTCGKIIR
ncbi:MAG: histidinol dehydrogenase, partial [Stenotrophomonas sp.]